MTDELQAKLALLKTSGLFDPQEYSLTAEAMLRDEDPARHYLLNGEPRGVRPSSRFDPVYYREKYGVVEVSQVIHYILVGKKRSFRTRSIVDDFAFTGDAGHGRPRIVLMTDGADANARQRLDVLLPCLQQSFSTVVVVPGVSSWNFHAGSSAVFVLPRSDLDPRWTSDPGECKRFVSWIRRQFNPEALVCDISSDLKLLPYFSREFIPPVLLVSDDTIPDMPRAVFDLAFSHASSIVFGDGTQSKRYHSVFPALVSRRSQVAGCPTTGGEEQARFSGVLVDALERAKAGIEGIQGIFDRLSVLQQSTSSDVNETLSDRDALAKVREFCLIRGWDTGKGPIFSSPKIDQGMRAKMSAALVELHSLPEEQHGVLKTALVAEPSTIRIAPVKDISPPAGMRVALHGHFFYPEFIDELFDCLSDNKINPELYLSTDTVEKSDFIAERSRQREFRTEIRILPNRGRDIAPFFVGFRDLFEVGKYDLIGHVHGKKSPHIREDRGERWRTWLLHNLIGSEYRMMDVVADAMNEDRRLGLVFPHMDSFGSWDANFPIGQSLAERMGLKIDISRPFFDFPVGTMFWARPSALRPLLELDLQWDDFPLEPLPVDGTICHGIERILSFVCEAENYSIGTTVL